MITPTPRQLELLRYLAGHIEAKGVAPSYDQMEAGTGMGRALIHNRMVALEERGHIRRAAYGCSNRAIELLHKPAIPRAPDGAPLYAVRLP